MLLINRHQWYLIASEMALRASYSIQIDTPLSKKGDTGGLE